MNKKSAVEAVGGQLPAVNGKLPVQRVVLNENETTCSSPLVTEANRRQLAVNDRRLTINRRPRGLSLGGGPERKQQQSLREKDPLESCHEATKGERKSDENAPTIVGKPLSGVLQWHDHLNIMDLLGGMGGGGVLVSGLSPSSPHEQWYATRSPRHAGTPGSAVQCHRVAPFDHA